VLWGTGEKSLMKNHLSKKKLVKNSNAILTFYTVPDMDQKKYCSRSKTKILGAPALNHVLLYSC